MDIASQTDPFLMVYVRNKAVGGAAAITGTHYLLTHYLLTHSLTIYSLFTHSLTHYLLTHSIAYSVNDFPTYSIAHVFTQIFTF